MAAIEALSAAVKRADWPALLAAYSRCARIVAGQPVATVAMLNPDPSAEAQTLARALDALPAPADAPAVLANLGALVAPINAFFEKTMVMVDDPALRASRLIMLGRVVSQSAGVLDISKLDGF